MLNTAVTPIGLLVGHIAQTFLLTKGENYERNESL